MIQPTCPTCGAPHAPDETVCLRCGFVFGSQPMPNHAPPLQPVSLPVKGVPLQPGQTLQGGRYTITEPLSRGGMGALYLAHDHGAFERPVVVKVLLGGTDPTLPERFLDEARALAALKHPNIPQIFAYFQERTHTCIVMEYVEGLDLEHGLTRINATTGAVEPGQAYQPEDVLHWGVAVCTMLQYLTSRMPPVVHQDIKPANLVFDHNSDSVFLVDFGTVGGRKRYGSAYGTPGYAPPEQYKGNSEPRSDVYALAATLYHLATDDDPRQHQFQFPLLDQLGALGAVLRPALQHDVTQRPTAKELRQQLAALLVERVQPPVTPTLPPITTPNGVNLRDLPDLLRWCEANWFKAQNWLYGQLPEQIETTWHDAFAAKLMRDTVQRYGTSATYALDSVLAQLDPHGYGASPPQLTADPFVLDLGDIPPDARLNASVTVKNTGRRYVQAFVQDPSNAWLNVLFAGWLLLAPGEQRVIDVAVDLRKVHPPPSFRNVSIAVVEHGQPLLHIDIVADIVAGAVLHTNAKMHHAPSPTTSGTMMARGGQVQPEQPQQITQPHSSSLENRISDFVFSDKFFIAVTGLAIVLFPVLAVITGSSWFVFLLIPVIAVLDWLRKQL